MKMLLLLFLLVVSPCFAAGPEAPPPPRAAGSPAPPAPVGPEAEKEAYDFVRLVAPFRLTELQALRGANFPEYEMRVREVLDVKHKMDFARKNDPKRYELMMQETKMEQESLHMGELYQRAEEQDKERIRKDMKGLLEQLFDVKEQSKQMEVKRLEDELARLKNSLAERRKNKSQIVSIRMEELLDEKNTFRW